MKDVFGKSASTRSYRGLIAVTVVVLSTLLALAGSTLLVRAEEAVSQPAVINPEQPASLSGSGVMVSQNRKVIYLYNIDYPRTSIVKYPADPTRLTHFWKLMDREMNQTQSLALTENLDEADYRVELKCAGVTGCSKLRVYIKSPKRDVLAAFTLRNIKDNPLFGNRPLEEVAHRLTSTLEERIEKLQEGDYGYANY